MSWDLIIGLTIGLSGSIITLIGTIVANKQNHEIEIEFIRQNHELQIQLSIQKFALESSFK